MFISRKVTCPIFLLVERHLSQRAAVPREQPLRYLPVMDIHSDKEHMSEAVWNFSQI